MGLAVLDEHVGAAFHVRKTEQIQRTPSHSLPVLVQVAVCFVKALPVASQGQSREYLGPCVSQFCLSPGHSPSLCLYPERELLGHGSLEKRLCAQRAVKLGLFADQMPSSMQGKFIYPIS